MLTGWGYPPGSPVRSWARRASRKSGFAGALPVIRSAVPSQRPVVCRRQAHPTGNDLGKRQHLPVAQAAPITACCRRRAMARMLTGYTAQTVLREPPPAVMTFTFILIRQMPSNPVGD